MRICSLTHVRLLSQREQWQKPKSPVKADKFVYTSKTKQEAENGKTDLSRIRCFYCQKTGHKVAQCRLKQQKEDSEGQKNKSGTKNSSAPHFSPDLLVSKCRLNQ